MLRSGDRFTILQAKSPPQKNFLPVRRAAFQSKTCSKPLTSAVAMALCGGGRDSAGDVATALVAAPT